MKHYWKGVIVTLESDYSIRTLIRASEILGCFTLSEPEKSLTAIARETGLHKSTVFRIMKNLEKVKWVRKDFRLGTYRLGFAIFELGVKAIIGLDIYRISLPHLENLVKATSQAAHLVINDNGEALYLNKVESPGAFIAQPSQIGLRLPMHCTAVGKVLLSFMEEVKAFNIIEQNGLKKNTHNTLNCVFEKY